MSPSPCPTCHGPRKESPRGARWCVACDRRRKRADKARRRAAGVAPGKRATDPKPTLPRGFFSAIAWARALERDPRLYARVRRRARMPAPKGPEDWRMTVRLPREYRHRPPDRWAS